MEQFEYRMIQDQLLTIAGLASMLDLEGFVAAASKAESIGFLTDPTAYRLAMDRLPKIRELAEAMIRVKMIRAELANIVLNEESSPGWRSLAGQVRETREALGLPAAAGSPTMCSSTGSSAG
jgi:hypothetical protein